jgi:chaperonin GroEL
MEERGMIRKIKFEDGRKKLAEGILSLCRVLSLEGQVLVNGAYSFSAAEVAGKLEGTDLYFNQGIRLGAAAIGEINQAAGCGTGESARLTAELLAYCERKSASGISPVLLARELKAAAKTLEAFVREKAIPLSDASPELVEEITKNRETAQMVVNGSNVGEVVVKDSMFGETRLEITRGMRLDGGLTVGAEGTVSDALILIVKTPIISFSSLYPILQKTEQQNLFILADGIEGEALTLLNTNVKQNRIHTRAMKAPGIGRRKEDLLEDAAVYTDTVVFDGIYPCRMEEVSPAMLGRAKAVTAAGSYTIIKGNTNNNRICRRIEAIEERISDPKTNYYDKQKLRERIAGLMGCAPVIYTGGYTTAEAKEEKRRIESAVAYYQTMKQYGVLKKEDLNNVTVGSEAEKFLTESMKQAFKKEEISAYLLILMIQKICGLVAMWLTTGAVMVSTGYDREDLELIRSGVDIERLRG